MLVKDFFRLIIKLFGLYALIMSVFSILPYSGSFFAQGVMGAEFWIIVVVIFVLMILLFMLLMYSTDNIVDKLDLDRGFINPTIDLGKLDDQTIIKTGCIHIGGFLIVDNLGSFLANIYLLFRQNEIDEPVRKNDILSATIALRLLIGYLLITNYDRVSLWLVVKKTEN